MQKQELSVPNWMFSTAAILAESRRSNRSQYIRGAIAFRIARDLRRLRDENPRAYEYAIRDIDTVRDQDPKSYEWLIGALDAP
jgi:hypothetical protein